MADHKSGPLGNGTITISLVQDSTEYRMREGREKDERRMNEGSTKDERRMNPGLSNEEWRTQ